MHRRRIVLLAALSAPLLLAGEVSTAPGIGAAVATNPTQACPIIAGIDPDFVAFHGPAVIPADGLVHSVSVFASEVEPAANVVSLTTVTTVRTASSSIGRSIAVATSVDQHETTVQIPLSGIQGRTYVINWIATFDFGPHVCTSLMPGNHAFTVGVR